MLFARGVWSTARGVGCRAGGVVKICIHIDPPLLVLKIETGMGSTGSETWDWASQSQVFGGARACMKETLLASGKEIPTNSTESGCIGDKENAVDNKAYLEASGEDPDAAMEQGDSDDGDDVAEDIARCSDDFKGVTAAERDRSRRRLQAQNFRIMHAWLSRTRSLTTVTPDLKALHALPTDLCSSLSNMRANGSTAVPAASTANTKFSPPTLLDVALRREDGLTGAAFMTLASMDTELLRDAPTHDNDPIVLALRLYHQKSTWKRLCRRPTPRPPGTGPGSRLHPNDPALAAAVNDAYACQRESRVSAEYESAAALVRAGLAVSLADDGTRRTIRDCTGDTEMIDELAALAIREVLTAAEMRALAKCLGVSVSSPIGTNEQRGAFDRRTWSGGTGGNGSGDGAATTRARGSHERGHADGKDEVCSAIERWFSRPADVAKRRARVAHAAQQAVRLISTVRGSSTKGRVRGGGTGAGADGGDSQQTDSGVLVLRLADDAREAIHRIYVSFFAAALHGPHDVPALLREDLTRVTFGGADAVDRAVAIGKNPSCGSGSSAIEEGSTSPTNGMTVNISGESKSAMPHAPTDQKQPPPPPPPQGTTLALRQQASIVSTGCGKRGDNANVGEDENNRDPLPAPKILCSVEVFAQYYRLVVLADELDLAACAGDSG